jgi:tRNA-dihydrouridine synthase
MFPRAMLYRSLSTAASVAAPVMDWTDRHCRHFLRARGMPFFF